MILDVNDVNDINDNLTLSMRKGDAILVSVGHDRIQTAIKSLHRMMIPMNEPKRKIVLFNFIEQLIDKIDNT